MSDFRKQIRSKFTPEELEVYRQHFDIFDLNGDGMVSARELDKVCSHLGYRMTKHDIKEIMRAVDLDSSGSLSFDEFLLAMPGNANISKDEHKAAEIRRAFMDFDKDGDGIVTIEEAHKVLKHEFTFTVKQSMELVKRYDKNKDGRLSYEEFVQFYMKIRKKAEQIREMFEKFDKDKSGTISVDEAKVMLSKVNIPPDEVEGLVKIHDTNQDGELQYEEFVSFLIQT